MAAQLKNTLSFVNLAPGASVVLPHELNFGTRALAPDIIFVPSAALSAVSDTVSVTLTNDGPGLISGDLLVEAWHSVERVFGSVQNLNLPVKPYIVVSVEGGNAPPQPPFAMSLVTIYARTTGSDTTGDGRTIATAYRTFQRAIRDVPSIVPPGNFYVVDITDLGDEVLPTNYELPRWINSHAFTLDFSDPFFFIRTGVNIRADFKPAASLTPAQAVIAGAPVITSNPTTGIVSIQDPTKVGPNAWIPGALKGLEAVGAIGPFESSVIYGNTTDTIFVTTIFAPTVPIRIMEQSARLLTTTDLFGFAGGITVAHQDGLTINGIRIEATVPGAFASIQVFGGTTWFFGCWIVDGFFDDPVRQNDLEFCNLVGPEFTGPTTLFGNRIEAMSLIFRAQLLFMCVDGNVLDACGPIEIYDGSQGIATAGGLLLLHNALILNSSVFSGDGVIQHGGNTLARDVEVSGATGNAFVFTGPGFHQLENVVGTGNGGVGIKIDNGAQVQKDPATTVTGAADFQIGAAAPAAYPANPFNVTDVATFSRFFDPTP
jgi:hypothetical protein